MLLVLFIDSVFEIILFKRGYEMTSKRFSHKVTLSDRRRTNKKVSDYSKKGSDRKELKDVFNTYYRDQVRALYRAVQNEK